MSPTLSGADAVHRSFAFTQLSFGHIETLTLFARRDEWRKNHRNSMFICRDWLCIRGQLFIEFESVE